MGGCPARRVRLGPARAWVVATAFLAACAGPALRIPDDVSGYDLLVSGSDAMSRALAAALSREGFRVRTLVRGGNRPTAVLVHFVFREGPGDQPVLYGRLADTRTGRIVASAAIHLDGLSAAMDSVPTLARELAKKPS